MNVATILVLLALALWAGLALRSRIRHRKSGSSCCCGNCSDCSGCK